jgi:hypothetical protein
MFCVYLTIYLGKLLPPFYIGSTSTDKIANGYHGTVTSKRYSQIWKTELRNNPGLFRTSILSFHETRKMALAKELHLQKINDVVKNESFINLSFASVNGFFGCSQKGVAKTVEHSKNISVALKGKSKTVSHIKACREAIRPKITEETRKALSTSCAGELNGNSKTFILIDPFGKTYSIKGGLRKFCKEKDLSFPKIYRHINCGTIKQMDCKKSANAKTCTGWEIKTL